MYIYQRNLPPYQGFNPDQEMLISRARGTEVTNYRRFLRSQPCNSSECKNIYNTIIPKIDLIPKVRQSPNYVYSPFTKCSLRKDPIFRSIN